ncbi:MAG: hydroxymethylbilane synthase [Actinomycetota bacterium]|nr:hydroxymethylbilane synthase [Actinomycetota bacterium]
MGERIAIATRGSPLALWQANRVAGLLRAVDPALAVELVVVETFGDRAVDRPIWEIGGRGVFVKEVQAAVLDGRADIAVHSAKDLPSSASLAAPGLVIAAVPERGDPRDVLVGRALDQIPPGGMVATGSTRRRAQLADLRPDLTFAGLRGNIDTRLAAAERFSAIVAAAAALVRLGHRERTAEALAPEVVVPQVGQGALAVECRADDDAARDLLGEVDHGPSHRALAAERGFLATLGGGCELPAGAYAVERTDGRLWLRAVLATLDGRQVLRDQVVVAAGADAPEAGRRLGEQLLSSGGHALLSESRSGPSGS